MPSTHTPLYIDTPQAADEFFASIEGAAALAVDTEGASFHRFIDRIYLLQISSPERTAVVDPLAVGTPARFGRLLEDPTVEVVFHDADYDLRLLHQDYGWHVRSIFDTRVAAQLLGIRAFGLAALLERYFGVKLDKKHQRADWSMRPLTQDMLDYAAQDTMYLLELRDRMREALSSPLPGSPNGRWHWAREEFGRLEGTRWDDEDASTGWMRIKGVRDLSRREMALFRELVGWRDGVARELDRSTFRVAGNDALMEAARLAPRSMDALVKVKGMPRGIAERRGRDVLAAIERGLAVPDAELPRFPRPPRWDRDPDFDTRVAALKQVRDEAATRLDLDPGVLCSRDRLELIARKRPQSLDELAQIPDMRRWQVEELGEALLRAMEQGESPYKS